MAVNMFFAGFSFCGKLDNQAYMDGVGAFLGGEGLRAVLA